MTSYGENIPPKTPKKGAWIGSFKPKSPNFYIAISPELLIRRSSNLRSEFRPRKALPGWSPLPQSKHNMADGRHLENRYDVIFPRRMFRFGWKSATGCRMTRGLGEMIEIETGSRIPIWRRLYFETGSNYITAANWDISTKFGLLIDFDLLKAVTSTNTKPEVVFSGILKNRHDVIFLQYVLWFGRNSVAWCKITCTLHWCGQSQNRK